MLSKKSALVTLSQNRFSIQIVESCPVKFIILLTQEPLDQIHGLILLFHLHDRKVRLAPKDRIYN